MKFSKKILPAIILPIVLSTQIIFPLTHQAPKLFKSWTTQQHVYADRNLSDITNHLNDDFINIWQETYNKNTMILQPLSSCINQLVSAQNFTNLCNLHKYFDHNMQAVHAYLDQLNFSTHASQKLEEGIDGSYAAVEKYKAFLHLVFAHKNPEETNHLLFIAANRVFEFCFGDKTFQQYLHMHTEKKTYPTLRLFYTCMWLGLSSKGWINWHEECLKALKKDHDEGKKIVYIAGGCDIYQLLKYGIYNFTIIDPLLSSQLPYYTPCFNVLTNSDIDDEITFPFDENPITLQCVQKLASTTTWVVINTAKQEVGTFTFEQRCAQTADFSDDSHKTVLLSFNELFFITCPIFAGGWNIDTTSMNNNATIRIKQLRIPISKKTIYNMKITTLLNLSDFHFISLGSNVE